jgi:predicted nucleotidyltransferase
VIASNRIADLADQIAPEVHPEHIILFGSHARGTATDDSDVDLLVVMPFQGHPSRQATEIRARVHPKFPVDLLVRTPQQVQERLALGDYFMQEVVSTGTVLYEAAHR